VTRDLRAKEEVIMRKNGALFATVALTLFSGTAVFAAPDMREGKWEITSTIDMPGMPMKIPPTVISHCYTKDDIKDEKRVVAGKNSDCTVTDVKKSGNKVSWKMKCTGKSKGTFDGETIFGKDSYTSTMNMKSEGRSMTTKVKARRIGACD
jgi:Protein of unknown function (DUF3617)